MSKDSKLLTLEKISGKDIKRYILGFNYCIENLESSGFYDSWFDNFYDTIMRKFIKLLEIEINERTNHRYEQIKEFNKERLNWTIKNMEEKFIKIQENSSDEFSDDDLDLFYKKIFNHYFQNANDFVPPKYENKVDKNFYQRFYEIKFTEIYPAIKQLFTRCGLMYNMKRKKHIDYDWVEQDLTKNATYKLHGDIKIIVRNGIMFKVDNTTIYGKIIRGSLYPLNEDDIKIVKKYSKGFIYKSKKIEEYETLTNDDDKEDKDDKNTMTNDEIDNYVDNLYKYTHGEYMAPKLILRYLKDHLSSNNDIQTVFFRYKRKYQ